MERRYFLQACCACSLLASGCSDRRDPNSEPKPSPNILPKMNTLVDIEKIANSISIATRLAFTKILQSTSRESLYGFCLYTVDDLAGIVPSASAESGFMERNEKTLANQDRLAWLKKNDIDVDRFILGDYRWSAYEWEFETEGGNFFADANAMLADSVAKVSDNNDSFTQLTAEVLAAFTIALHRLRTENLFDNEKTTLFCSKPSSSDTAWLESESARILNSPLQYATFERERIEWIKEDGDDTQDAIPLYRQLVSQYCKTK